MTELRDTQGIDAAAIIQDQALMLATLAKILETLQSSPAMVAVSNQATPPFVQEDFPSRGSTRLLIQRAATGGIVAVPAGKVTVVRPHNRTRLGGEIVNKGTKSVILLLAGQGAAEGGGDVAQIALEPGGSWDLRLAGMTWCGDICAKLVGEGESELTVAEV